MSYLILQKLGPICDDGVLNITCYLAQCLATIYHRA